ncbi:winged helix-turn-helix transcriptional regulator [Furfurilactobacillus sp. WILCCON 0119]
MKRARYECENGCSVESTLQLISGRWKSVLLYHLIFDGDLRFSELQKKIPGLSRRMLSHQLKELEDDHLVNRNVQQEKPLMVSYSVSHLGMSLRNVIASMYAWGNEFNDHNPSIEEFNLEIPQ